MATASLSLAASAEGWESSIKAMRSLPRTLKTEVSRRGKTLADPLAREVRAVGHAQGSHAARVADTVKSGIRAGVPTVTAGGKPYTMGSEWGGGIRRTTYVSHSRLGRPYLVVQRHTTRQFRPYRGKQGYWFTPTIQHGKGREVVLRAWADLVDQVIREF
jgi:hypothetical protein